MPHPPADAASSTDAVSRISVRDHTEAGVSSIRIEDAFLNYALSDELKSGLKGLCGRRIAAGTRGFVLDLSAVTVMDSCGLSVLISVKKAIEADGGRIGLAGLSPMIRRLFEITKLDRVFEIHADVASAVAALA